MFRFMSLIWNPAHSEQSEAVELVSRRLSALSSQWREAFCHSGLRVFCADPQPGSLAPHRLADNAGIVLGAIFERNPNPEDNTPSSKAVFRSHATASIVSSRGRILTANYWGNYVAFLCASEANKQGPDRTTHIKWVIKDPAGSLPCFTTSFRNVTLFFSCIADCRDLQILSLTLNHAYLKSRVVDSGSTYKHPPLEQISPLFRGECIQVDSTCEPAVVTRHWYWTPLAFPRSGELIEDPVAAARAMRSTVRAATHTLASCHDNLLLRLSGGLDSSIINGCLADAPTRPRVTCYTNFNPRGRSNERPWAKLAAQHSGFEHLECGILPEEISLEAALRMPASVQPASILEFLQRSTMERDLTLKYGATAVFNGDGGDSGFCSDSIRYALSEYLRLHSLRLAAFRLASQIAVLVQLSTWQVLARSLLRRATAVHSAVSRRELLKTCRLASPDLVEQLIATPAQDHPWLDGIEDVPGGLVQRLGMLMAMPDFYNAAPFATDRAAEIVAPLYSQPVVELLLRIPIHIHFESGRDRGLARRAFSSDVPQPILQRLWKDRAPGFHDELIHRNLNFLRAHFLDGVLVSTGLLDRAAVERTFAAGPTRSDVYAGEIINHMGTEIWARHWMTSMAVTSTARQA